jgi:hypothetical protein
MKFAPASACLMARFRINSASFAAMAFPVEGMAPLIFSPIIIFFLLFDLVYI